LSKELSFSRQAILPCIEQWRVAGFKIGYTSGVFDLLHAGHLDYLQKARARVDRLVVGVNSDSSVRANKGPSRPFIPQLQQATLIAGLKPVDGVFIFEELNNNLNIELLRPDVYIKAGDYRKSQLSSAPLVESYGGKIELIPVANNISTTELAELVVSRLSAVSLKAAKIAPRPVIFLDRDGVINEEIEYLHQPEKFVLKKNLLEGAKRLMDAGYALVVVTNQAGIGLGYFTHEDFYRVNKAMLRAVTGQGIFFDKIYYCPHSITENCHCRKPAIGMLQRAFEELNLVKEKSFMVGDQENDVDTGRAFGISTILITDLKKPHSKADYQASDLLQASHYILDK